jgi:proteasome lid subunit RPN8/RPN11
MYMFRDIFGKPFSHHNTELFLTGTVKKRLLAESKEAFPCEYSALLVGKEATVTGHIPMPSSTSSRDSFQWEGEALFRAMREIRQRELQWLGVLHTHPRSPAVPSSADRAGWHYPELSYWILSLSGSQPDLRVYQWENGDFQERRYSLCK